MSDLHERLLAIARDHEDHGDTPAAGMLGAAVRVVVELHAPVRSLITGNVVGCRNWCGQGALCSTIEAIARELGVDGG